MLTLAAHTDPDVGVDDVGFLRRYVGIVSDLDHRTGFCSLDPSPIHNMLLRLIPHRTTEGDGHPPFRRCLDQGICHIIPVAAIGDLDYLQPALLLANSQEV